MLNKDLKINHRFYAPRDPVWSAVSKLLLGTVISITYKHPWSSIWNYSVISNQIAEFKGIWRDHHQRIGAQWFLGTAWLAGKAVREYGLEPRQHGPWFPSTAITLCSLGGSNRRRLFSCSSGCWKSKIEVLRGLMFSWGVSLACRRPSCLRISAWPSHRGCLCPHLRFLEGHQFSWARHHLYDLVSVNHPSEDQPHRRCWGLGPPHVSLEDALPPVAQRLQPRGPPCSQT